MPKMQEQISAMASNMRAFPTSPTAMLGELYGARAKIKVKAKDGLHFANPPYLLQ
jgi:hypothetical protein